MRQLQLALHQHRLAALCFRLALSIATLALLMLSGIAFAQTPSAAPPTTVAVQLPGWSWSELIFGVLAAAFVWFTKRVEPHLHGYLQAKVADPATPKVQRTLAQIVDELEPLITSAVGHALPDVQAAVAAGKGPGQVTSDVAADLVDDLDAGLKAEAEKYFGSAGGSVVGFVEGLIKAKVHELQGAKVTEAVAAGAQAAAAAGSSGPAAVAAINAAP